MTTRGTVRGAAALLRTRRNERRRRFEHRGRRVLRTAKRRRWTSLKRGVLRWSRLGLRTQPNQRRRDAHGRDLSGSTYTWQARRWPTVFCRDPWLEFIARGHCWPAGHILPGWQPAPFLLWESALGGALARPRISAKRVRARD